MFGKVVGLKGIQHQALQLRLSHKVGCKT